MYLRQYAAKPSGSHKPDPASRLQVDEQKSHRGRRVTKVFLNRRVVLDMSRLTGIISHTDTAVQFDNLAVANTNKPR